MDETRVGVVVKTTMSRNKYSVFHETNERQDAYPWFFTVQRISEIIHGYKYQVESGKEIKMRNTTYDEWVNEGKRRFGKETFDWKFACPSCGYVASVQDWMNAGATEEQVAFSCIGRNLGSKKELFDKTGGPCNYAGGGLIGLNPVAVADGCKTHHVFEFANEVFQRGT